MLNIPLNLVRLEIKTLFDVPRYKEDNKRRDIGGLSAMQDGDRVALGAIIFLWALLAIFIYWWKPIVNFLVNL